MANLEVKGPTLHLRYPTPDDADTVFEFASDREVTRWFAWGPYSARIEAETYLRSLEGSRESGAALDFLVVHADRGAIGMTGLSELSRRDRHATVGTWFGRESWGTGANLESKALIAELAFAHLGLDRLTAWANTRNGRSQRALERSGFRREGVLRDWHRHGEDLHDVLVYGLTRRAWERSELRQVPVTVTGTAPAAFELG